MTDPNWLTKRLAIVGIIYGAVISIGASFLSAGIGISFTIHPLIAQYIRDDNSVNPTTAYEHGIVNNLIQSANFFIWGGILLIVLSIISAIIFIYLPKQYLKSKLIQYRGQIHFNRSWYCQRYDEIERINAS